MKSIRLTNKITNRETDSVKHYLTEIANIEMFTPEEEAECSTKALNGDKKSFDELIRRNLRFVVSIAKQYETPNVSLEDLINEGNIGLIMAAENYNPNKGFKFITFAVWWIRKMILEYLAKHSRTVRLPANKINTLTKYTDKINQMEQKYGRNVDISEIIDEYSTTLTKEEIAELNNISILKFDSLDSSVNVGDNDISLYDMVYDVDYQQTDYLVSATDTKIQIKRILNTLKSRDRDIIIALFGLDGNTPLTLKEAGDKFNLTREMIRKIKDKSIKALQKVYPK